MIDNQAEYDIAIIGAGMVGASIAYHCAGDADVLVLEGESAAGYHSTGRSAAVFTETYGPPAVRGLSRASHAFFKSPPGGFADSPLLHRRGALFVGREDQEASIRSEYEQLKADGSRAEMIDTGRALAYAPVLRPETARFAIIDPDTFDIDVDLLLQGFLRGARQQGAELVKDASVSKLGVEAGRWRVETASGDTFTARLLVNAAGAWADNIAALAGVAGVSLQPKRRSAFIFAPPEDVACSDWPLVIDADEDWYFKPDAGQLLGSPANTDPVSPQDVVAEEYDIALGIHRIEEATTMSIHRPSHTWAGLRSFVADGNPVLGFDPASPAFFWAAGLGGYGIQTSPAMGRYCASLLLGRHLPEDIVNEGIDPGLLLPRR